MKSKKEDYPAAADLYLPHTDFAGCSVYCTDALGASGIVKNKCGGDGISVFSSRNLPVGKLYICVGKCQDGKSFFKFCSG